MPMYGNASKKSSTMPAPPMPTPPPMPLPPLGGVAGRMAQLGGSADVAPTWVHPAVNPLPQIAPMPEPSLPGQVAPPPAPMMPNMPNTPRMPAAQAVDSSAVAPGWAAANPMASPTGGEMFGAPIRTGIFRQMFRTGKQVGGPAGDALMNIGKPPMAAPPPMGPMGRPEEAAGPKYTIPPLPPAPQAPGREQHPPHLRAAYNRSAPTPPERGGRAGRLMNRVRGGATTSPRPQERRVGRGAY